MDARERARRKFEAWLAGRNQEEIARALNVTQATVSRFASGGFTIERLDDIARVMGTTPDWLVDSGALLYHAATPLAGELVPPGSLEHDLLDAFRALSAEQRALVLTFLQNFVRAIEQTGTPARDTGT